MISIRPYGRHFAVYDGDALLTVCVYRKGAVAVLERLMTTPQVTPTGGELAATAVPGGRSSATGECQCLITEEYLNHLGRPCPHVVCDGPSDAGEGRAPAPEGTSSRDG